MGLRLFFIRNLIAYLCEDQKNLLEMDLISMYFSSLRAFAGQTNIQKIY